MAKLNTTSNPSKKKIKSPKTSKKVMSEPITIKVDKNKSYTSQLSSKWQSKCKVEIAPFLDIPTTEGRAFFNEIIEEFFIEEKPLSKATTEELTKLRVFFLIQMARFIAPKDNNHFLIRALIHLENNPLFSNLLGGLVHVSVKDMNQGTINLPELGVFVAPSNSNKYTFAIPRSPKSVFLVYLGKNAHFYSDYEITDFSYSVTGNVLVHQDNACTKSVISEKQLTNERKVGNLCRQMEDPKPIADIIKGIVSELPGIKNNILLHKPIEMAMRFWQK